MSRRTSIIASGVVLSVNRSEGGIPKTPLDSSAVLESGLQGDGHDHDKHNTPLQAISLIDAEDLNDLREEGFDVYPGATGENVTLEGVSIDECDIGDIVSFEGGVTLELTKKRKPCFVLDSISPVLKETIVGRCGFYGKVIAEGQLRPGERVDVQRCDVAEQAASESAS